MKPSFQHSPVPAYAVQGLTFAYGSSDGSHSKAALHDLTCRIESDTMLGVLGPNGSGKSTFLKLLARIVRAGHGTIELFGEDLKSLSQRTIARCVALVPQETQQLFPFTIGEMVMMGRFPHHVGLTGWHWENENDLTIARDAMDSVEVAHLSARVMSDVSGGERQRAILARALTQQPKVLLLDEPMAFLDLHHQVDMARILRRLNQEQGMTVVMVSHDLNLASQICDQLMLLQEGQVVKVGRPDEVLQPELLMEVYRCPVLVDRHPQSGRPRVSLPILENA